VLPVLQLCSANRQCHQGAAEKKNAGVASAEDDLGVTACRLPGEWINEAVDRVGKKEPAEEENLGGKENPHPELGRFVLLLDVVKLLGKNMLNSEIGHRSQTPSHLRGWLRAEFYKDLLPHRSVNRPAAARKEVLHSSPSK
jgi:hypothetical protein